MVKRFTDFTDLGTIQQGDILVGTRANVNIQVNFNTGVRDSFANYMIGWESAGPSSTNYLKFLNAVSGSPALITSVGIDSNVSIKIKPKNSGDILTETNGDGSFIHNSIGMGGFEVNTGGYLNFNGSQDFKYVSDDVTLADDSSIDLVTEHAVKTYVDNSSAALANLTYITDTDETADLPNSFQLLGTANQTTVSNGVIGLSSTIETPGTFKIGAMGATVSSISTDGTFAANSDGLLSTQKAIKTYVTTSIDSLTSPSCSTFVSETGSDVTGEVNNFYKPFASMGAGAAAILALPDPTASTLYVYSQISGGYYEGVNLNAGFNDWVIFGISDWVGAITCALSDELGGTVSDGEIHNIYWDTIAITNYNGNIGRTFFYNGSVQTVVIDNDVAAPIGIGSGNFYRNTTFRGTIDYFPVGYAQQDVTMTDIYVSCLFNGDMTINGPNVNVIFYHSVNFPNLIYQNGATSAQVTIIGVNALADTVGTFLRADGMKWKASTATLADTYDVNTLLYAASTDAVSGLATTNRAALGTSATGVPNWLALTDGQIVIGSTAGAPAAASISAGAGINVTPGSNSITITNTDLGSSVTLTNAGTTSLVNDGVGPTLATKGLLVGTGMAAFGTSATDVTINLSVPVTIANGGTNTTSAIGASGTLAQSDGSKYTFTTATYPATAGTAGTIHRSNGTNIVNSTSTFADTYAVSTLLYAGSTNAVSGLATTNRAAFATSATGVPNWLALTDGQLVIGSTAGAPAAAAITQGAGITVTNGSNSITITNSDTGSAVTLTNAGTTSLVNDGVGPALATKGLAVGTGMAAFGTSATDVTINLSVPVTIANGGTNTTSAIGAAGTLATSDGTKYTFTTATYPATAAGTGTILRANGTNWAATTATYPNTTTVSQILYSSSANVVGGITTANSGVLVTNSTGVPAFSGTMTNGQLIIGSTGGTPTAAALTQGTNIAITNGAASITVGLTGTVAIANGGTNTNSAIGTANTLAQSDGTKYTWTTATFSPTYSASVLLYSNGANKVEGLATANSSVLVTNSSGVPAYSSTMTNGQLIIGSTSGTPTAATITQGTGITITNGAGTITIAAAGGSIGYIWMNTANWTGVSFAFTTSYQELTTLGTNFTLASASNNFAMTTDGRLKYTGTPTISCIVSATLYVSNGGNFAVQLYKNGVAISGSEAYSAGSAGVSVVNFTVSSVATNDYFSIFAKRSANLSVAILQASLSAQSS